MIPIGGHIIPTSIAGDSDESKYDQKKETKNITSLRINNINPHRMDNSSLLVWNPSKDSRITSRHQINMIDATIDSDSSTHATLLYALSHITRFNIKQRIEIDKNSGQ